LIFFGFDNHTGAGSGCNPLHGKRPADDLIADVADAADKPSRPLDNTDLSHYWRKRMTKVYIERALRDACGLDPLGGRLTAQVASR